jgi:hypothetical protein
MVTGKINRSDWRITWNNTSITGLVLADEEISICCGIEFIEAYQEELTIVSESAEGKKDIL